MAPFRLDCIVIASAFAVSICGRLIAARLIPLLVGGEGCKGLAELGGDICDTGEWPWIFATSGAGRMPPLDDMRRVVGGGIFFSCCWIDMGVPAGGTEAAGDGL